ncbi:MAG: M28 family peptidase [Bdellovibrionales bacterium]
MRRGLWLVCLLVVLGCGHTKKKADAPAAQGPQFLSAIKQVTFEGLRSGEGYFSADGRQMIFQAEREPGNPFYQIYVRDMQSGETERVSNGQGKTTCAWLHPTQGKALYASTHKDPRWRDKAKQQYEIRQKGEREKYSWSYDDQYDLYEKNLKTKALKVLSPARGYDAEGSYSPDGQWIAFASNRHAYSDQLTAEESKRRDEDPSYFLEIYLMKADGTGLKRLTQVPGYDGGPFFSPDGQSLVWRRFTADGRMAEVWTMKLDGTEQKQITRMQAMSWAPFYHPSGDYIIFTTNKLGYDNFELYIVDREGLREPVRATYRPGFDGLPVFTPDGSKLAWTQRNEKGESQIFMGDWDDANARRSLGLPPRTAAPGLGDPAFRPADAKQWVEYLASPEMKGRRSGSDEEKQYSKTIARQFERIGLKPMLKEGYLQAFRYQSGVRLNPQVKSNLSIEASKTMSAQINRDWVPMSFSANGKFAWAEVVFAGYGIVAPASDKVPAYDAYQGLDVKGRWVMVLRDMPNDIPNEQRFHLNLYTRLQHKALVARQAGALGLLVVSPVDKTVQLRFEGAGSGVTSIPVLAIGATLAEDLLQATGQGLAAWQKELDAGQVRGMPLKEIKLAAEVAIEAVESEALNVLAHLDVPGAKSTVLIGAHGDHLGTGESGNSLAKDNERGQIHHGADDNASGVAAVMELAHHFTQQVQSGKLRPKTNLAFAVWSAEEVGILGSTHFVKNYPGTLKAYLNLDMVGRLRDQLVVQGTGSAEQWGRLLEPAGASTGVAMTTQSDPYLPTDAMAFYLKKVPSLSFFTGAHHEYHSPRDTADLINYPGLVSVAQVVANVAERLSNTNEPLTYKKVEGQGQSSQGRGFRLYLGTIPDYTQDGIKGVKISGTTKASPAEMAGLQEGDIIVELGGIKIDNIQDYVYCLQSMKANQKTPLRVMRQGRVVELEIVPALKGM